MKTFVFGATVLEPDGLTPEARDSFRSAIQAAGAADLRVNEDDEGRITVSFRIEEPNERVAMKKGSEITLSALKEHPLRWVASGVTYWQAG